MLPPKDPSETVPISFDFGDEVASVSAPAVAVSVLKGTDPNAASMPTGAATVSGAIVTQMVRAGVADCDYALRCVVNGPSGEVLLRAGVLYVRTMPR